MSAELAKSILANGPSRPTLYAFNSSKLQKHIRDYLNFYCLATQIPALRYNSIIASGHENMGISREMPTFAVYEKPLTLTILLDSDWKIYRAIRAWLDQACVNINQSTSPNMNRTQRIRYYGNYVSDLDLYKLENKDGSALSLDALDDTQVFRKVITTRFINAYPIEIKRVNLSSGASNEISTFDVEFTYESYHMPELNEPYQGTLGAVGSILSSLL